MTIINVDVPNVLHVDMKDFPAQQVATGKWTNETVCNLVRFALKVQLERRKNSGGESATDASRRDAVAKAVAELNEGTFELRAGAAAKLDLKEEEFRKLLAKMFEVRGGCKKTDAANHARIAGRVELFRDLVVKKQLSELGVSVTSEELEQKTKSILFTLEQKAENNAAAIEKMRQDMEISFG